MQGPDNANGCPHPICFPSLHTFFTIPENVINLIYKLLFSLHPLSAPFVFYRRFVHSMYMLVYFVYRISYSACLFQLSATFSCYRIQCTNSPFSYEVVCLTLPLPFPFVAMSHMCLIQVSLHSQEIRAVVSAKVVMEWDERIFSVSLATSKHSSFFSENASPQSPAKYVRMRFSFDAH